MCNMQAGTQMIKLRGKSKALVRLFYLDEHKSCIRWRPSRKHEKAKSKSDCVAGKHEQVSELAGHAVCLIGYMCRLVFVLFCSSLVVLPSLAPP